MGLLNLSFYIVGKQTGIEKIPGVQYDDDDDDDDDDDCYAKGCVKLFNP